MICFFIARSLPAVRLKSTLWSEASLADAQAIVTAERLRRTRQIGLADFVNRLRAG
jgi:hypothetical protein